MVVMIDGRSCRQSRSQFGTITTVEREHTTMVCSPSTVSPSTSSSTVVATVIHTVTIDITGWESSTSLSPPLSHSLSHSDWQSDFSLAFQQLSNCYYCHFSASSLDRLPRVCRLLLQKIHTSYNHGWLTTLAIPIWHCHPLTGTYTIGDHRQQRDNERGLSPPSVCGHGRVISRNNMWRAWWYSLSIQFFVCVFSLRIIWRILFVSLIHSWVNYHQVCVIVFLDLVCRSRQTNGCHRWLIPFDFWPYGVRVVVARAERVPREPRAERWESKPGASSAGRDQTTNTHIQTHGHWRTDLNTYINWFRFLWSFLLKVPWKEL